ncbi:MAG: hypothetical protein U1E23_15270 [Reyranellaceae bacterium]
MRYAMAVAAMVAGASLSAQAQTLASADDVRTAFANKTAYITHRNGATQKAFFAADGVGKVTEKGGVRTGNWTVEKNTICHNLSTERKCYTVTRKGPDTFELQSTDMKWMPSYRLVVGNTESL